VFCGSDDDAFMCMYTAYSITLSVASVHTRAPILDTRCQAPVAIFAILRLIHYLDKEALNSFLSRRRLRVMP